MSDQVFDQLSSEIMGGSYAFGSSLPAERTLAIVFKVNRHVVREALKRLEQVGLVRIAQGGGTRVLDPWEHAGLDLLALLADRPRSGHDAATFWLAVLEMRTCIGADVVRLCALRATPEIKQEVMALARAMESAPDEQTIFTLELRFWRSVHEGANNLVYRLAFNSLVKAALALGELSHRWSAREVRRGQYHLPVAEAITAGDGPRAEALMRDLMQASVDHLRGSMTRADPSAPTPDSDAALLPSRRHTTAGPK